MERRRTILAALLGGLVVLALGARTDGVGPSGGDGSALVVGTFDSRAIAIAHVRSQRTLAYLRAQKEDLERAAERARDAGDRVLADEIDALGPRMQERVHRQGFGTAPVDALLEGLGKHLPEVAAEAGVDVIVSKWQLAWHDPDARFVDVTERLVACFDPDEATLRAIREIMAQDPVPDDELDEKH